MKVKKVECTYKKTKIITTAENTQVRVQINNDAIETIQGFNFLGSKIDQWGDFSTEIRRRITFGKTVMSGINNISKSKHISSQPNAD